MQSEDFSIENRVANSALETFNLEDHYPIGQRITLDLSQWLHEGFILKEKDFRTALKAHDWSQYQNQNLALFCSTDAIIPAWAYILVTAQLGPFTSKKNKYTLTYHSLASVFCYFFSRKLLKIIVESASGSKAAHLR